ASAPNVHLLLLLERLLRVPAVRALPESGALLARAVAAPGLYSDEVTLQQYKLLAAVVQDGSDAASPSPAGPAALARCVPALVASLAAPDAALREQALALLKQHVDLSPAALPGLAAQLTAQLQLRNADAALMLRRALARLTEV